MTGFLTALCVLSVAAQSPQDVGELRALARDGPDSVLVERLRRGPRDLREALRQLLAEARGGDDSAGLATVTAADHLASAWVIAWRDSFYVRKVSRFRSLSPADRQVNVTADSVLRAGNDALNSAGVDAAMPAWRESLRLHEGLADSAGIARALVAMAGGFKRASERDSAEMYFTRCRDLAERIRDYSTLGNVITQQADMKQARGDLGGATKLLVQAKAILERAGDPIGVASNQNILAIVAFRRGDLAGARSAFEAALIAYRSGGSEANAAMILGNLGVVAGRAGDYAESAARYGEALSTYRKLGRDPDAAVMLRNIGALEMNRGDYPAAITALSEAVAILGRTGPVSQEIDARVLLSDARSDMGDLQGAVTELDRAEALARHWQGGGAWGARLALARGHLAFRFNRLAEAEREYARAQRLPPDAGADEVRTRNRAQLGMAEVLVRRGNYRDAQLTMERLLQRGDFGIHNDALARVQLGEAARRAGDTATARRAFREAIDTLQSLGSADDEADALAELGDLEVKAGRALAAESLYEHAITRLGTLPAVNAWRLHAGLAGALRRRGAVGDAVTELQRAIAQIERVSGRVVLEERRSAFRADKWDVYVDLALVERARGRTEAALELSERLRARQMLELLARARPATAVSGGSLAGREDDLRRKIAELTQQLDTQGGGADRGLRDPAAVATANTAAAEALAGAQEEYATLLLEMREANPAYAALVRGEIAPASTIKAALAPDEALLEYLVGDSTTIVFVVTRDTLVSLDLNVSHSTLAGRVDFARGTLGSPTEGGAQRAWRPSLRRLYRQLVAPVEASGLLAGKRRLVIAPHAELHYLPFATLVVPGQREQLLIERYVIEYVPSASVWLRLRDRPAPSQGGGVLALAPRAATLPGSQAEVAAIQRIFGARARTLVGTPATERAFRTLAPGQEIVHLATYGVLNKQNPMFSFVELGAGGAGGGEGAGGAGGDEDGRLEVHEVFGLTLNARLLVLSACQTGVGAGALTDVPPGDDWVGLVQGFLYAGASNVMATLWPVSDVATARLMERFYKELAAGRPEGEALALAQRAAARDAGTAHPFYWAGFTLVRGR
ncbi:MAG TPA: CHAT domain-containing protein [Gemmatimonadales bacterium]|nr:CHAT domain-containing protein [Gemmatimonadales bacterium]